MTLSRASSLWLGLAMLLAVATPLACSVPAPARFPHDEHLTKLECGGEGQPKCLACKSCHVQSTTDGELLPPEPKLCAPCHDDARKVLAESRLPERGPGEAIRFSHPDHLEREGIRGQCVKCHGGVVDEDPHAPAFPPMDTCLDCHQAEFDQARCSDCHGMNELAELKPVTFMRHDASWMTAHGLAAAQSAEVCASCHAQESCTDCHDLSQTLPLTAKFPEAVFRTMPHRADFLTRHPIEARTQPDRCMSCHTPASCDSCHTARGVSANRADARSPHPAGWVGRDTRSRDFHGRAARRDILSCAGCHDQGPATNCIECHRPGAPGGSPHPGGWRNSQSMEDGVCRYCHE